ncbi:lytic transglycosylase domain-containing protein [Cytobacillus sp. Hm23]
MKKIIILNSLIILVFMSFFTPSEAAKHSDLFPNNLYKNFIINEYYSIVEGARKTEKIRVKEKYLKVKNKSVEIENHKLAKFLSSYTDEESAFRYIRLCREYGKEYDISFLWLLSIMKVESTFDKTAVSYFNAIGLMQILPSTASMFGVTKKQLFDPEINVELATRYLRQLINQTGTLKMATISYNQGIGNVKKGNYNIRYYTKVLKVNMQMEEIIEKKSSTNLNMN